MTPEEAAWLASFPAQNPNPVIELELKDHSITYRNPAAEKSFPEMKESVKDHPLFKEVFKRLSLGKDFTCEVLIDGKCYEQKVYLRDGSSVIRVYCSDVTTQKQIEKNLARLASFPEQNPNPIVEIDRQFNITYFNPATLLHFPSLYAQKTEHSILKPILGKLADLFHGSSIPFNHEIKQNGKCYDIKPKFLPEGDVIRIFYNDITAQKKAEDLIREKNKDITDSINYAHRIQRAIMPPVSDFRRSFHDSFICYHPKDIVSGDFYFHLHLDPENVIIYAAADCTGHGVPGAMMSMVGSSLIMQTVMDHEVASPAKALLRLDDLMRRQLKQEEGGIAAYDGMDLALCAYNPSTGIFQFSGANRPLILIRNGEVKEFAADKFHIGGPKTEKHFSDHSFKTEPGDCLYIFTDGVHDQFGGPEGKKIMKKHFIQALLESHHLPMAEQQTILEEKFEKWKGDLEQVDDVLVIGVRITPPPLPH